MNLYPKAPKSVKVTLAILFSIILYFFIIEDASAKAETNNPAIFGFSKNIEKMAKEYTLKNPFPVLLNLSLAVYTLEAKHFKETRSLLYDYRNRQIIGFGILTKGDQIGPKASYNLLLTKIIDKSQLLQHLGAYTIFYDLEKGEIISISKSK